MDLRTENGLMSIRLLSFVQTSLFSPKKNKKSLFGITNILVSVIAIALDSGISVYAKSISPYVAALFPAFLSKLSPKKSPIW